MDLSEGAWVIKEVHTVASVRLPNLFCLTSSPGFSLNLSWRRGRELCGGEDHFGLPGGPHEALEGKGVLAEHGGASWDSAAHLSPYVQTSKQPDRERDCW